MSKTKRVQKQEKKSLAIQKKGGRKSQKSDAKKKRRTFKKKGGLFGFITDYKKILDTLALNIDNNLQNLNSLLNNEKIDIDLIETELNSFRENVNIYISNTLDLKKSNLKMYTDNNSDISNLLLSYRRSVVSINQKLSDKKNKGFINQNEFNKLNNITKKIFYAIDVHIETQ